MYVWMEWNLRPPSNEKSASLSDELHMQFLSFHSRLLVLARQTGSIIMLLREDVAPFEHKQTGATLFPSLPFQCRAHICLFFRVLHPLTSCNVTQTGG